MKSIKRRFDNIKEKRQGWSSYACFAVAVTGQKFNRDAIHRWFNKLVEKGDYSDNDKNAIFAHLKKLTNAVRTPKKGTTASV